MTDTMIYHAACANNREVVILHSAALSAADAPWRVLARDARTTFRKTRCDTRKGAMEIAKRWQTELTEVTK